ncbi:MAG: amidohydrolase family protein, partial [Phycisphaerales bacterium]
QSAPPSDLRAAKLDAIAIVGGDVVVRPGETIESATVLVSDGVIVEVGPTASIEVPAGFRVVDAAGLRVYPGLIDAGLQQDSNDAATAAAKEVGAHWNAKVVPQVDSSRLPALSESQRKALRELGFTSAAAHPDRGLLRGSGAGWARAADAPRMRRDRAMMAAAFEHGGDWDRATYPGAFVGAVALLRQTLLDAQWHAECRARWEADPSGLEPPVPAMALEALEGVVLREQPLVMRTDSELATLVAAEIAAEFGIDLVINTSGLEFRRAAEIAGLGHSLIVPLDFPEAPSADSPWQAGSVSLRDLLTWEQAPTNAKRLLAAGATVALTTDRLARVSEFPAKVRAAMDAGLSFDEMLAALTTAPAAILGIERIAGTIEPGKQADFVLVEGELFGEDSKVREVWIGGVRHLVAAKPIFALVGEATITLADGSTRRMKIDPEAAKVEVWPSPQAEVEKPEAEAAPEATSPELAPAAEAKPAAAPRAIRASGVRILGDTLVMRIDGEALGLEGPQRVSAVLVGGALRGVAEGEDGTIVRFTAIASADPAPIEAEEVASSDDAAPEGDVDGRNGDVEVAASAPPGDPGQDPQFGAEQAEVATVANAGSRRSGSRRDEAPDWTKPLPVPLGAFGVSEARSPERVLFRNATLWTCGPEGVVEAGDLLIEDGQVAYAGPRKEWSFEVGLEPRIEDLSGRHVTPGLIDCHSHTGLFGGVNESTRNSTSEVRMADAIDPDDIDWYRQLAGGLTIANQLHGSANPIGGQNSVVKIRWGDPREAMRFEEAPPGIKFALGENVVRPRGRYPQTRMGVEAFLDDNFEAARRYRQEALRFWALPEDEQARTMPPRPDLQLEALAEILEGERLVHCHSYRQDEILMLLRLAERQGFTVGTLQHVLEGFKVADAIADHGAGASSFSDWWAYKMEVMDALPENGAIMDQVGVLVSFNSDSDEHARRMNTEAAKAVRYGGIAPERALLFVTLNPAKQLGIDDRVGSLEAGKDADFAVWSAPPLSGLARCEQTWIDGVQRFSLEDDARLAAEADSERRRLLARVLDAGGGG